MKLRQSLSLVVMLAALLAGWFAPLQHSFQRRWPTALPPAMSLELFQAARKAAERPTFCAYPSPNCLIG